MSTWAFFDLGIGSCRYEWYKIKYFLGVLQFQKLCHEICLRHIPLLSLGPRTNVVSAPVAVKITPQIAG
jgi:hypothetical protein